MEKQAQAGMSMGQPAAPMPTSSRTISAKPATPMAPAPAPMAAVKMAAKERWKDIVSRKKQEHGVQQADKSSKPEAFRKALKDADRDYTSKAEKKASLLEQLRERTQKRRA